MTNLDGMESRGSVSPKSHREAGNQASPTVALMSTQTHPDRNVQEQFGRRAQKLADTQLNFCLVFCLHGAVAFPLPPDEAAKRSACLVSCGASRWCTRPSFWRACAHRARQAGSVHLWDHGDKLWRAAARDRSLEQCFDNKKWEFVSSTDELPVLEFMRS